MLYHETAETNGASQQFDHLALGTNGKKCYYTIRSDTTFVAYGDNSIACLHSRREAHFIIGNSMAAAAWFERGLVIQVP